MQIENENENGNQPNDGAGQPDGTATDSGTGQGLDTDSTRTNQNEPVENTPTKPDAFTEDHCLRVERRGNQVKVIKKPGSNCACRLDLEDTDIATIKKLAPMFLAIAGIGQKDAAAPAEPDAPTDQD